MEAMDIFTEKATIAITNPSTSRLGKRANGGADGIGSLKQEKNTINNDYIYIIFKNLNN